MKNAGLNNGEKKSRRRSTGTGVSPPGKKSTALNPVSHEVAEDIHLILLSDLILFTRRVVKPKTIFRRAEKIRYHIAEIVSLLDAKVSTIIPPNVQTKGLM